MKTNEMPEEEKNFQRVYVKAPSFLSIHMGVKATVLPPETDCHHFILEVISALLFQIFRPSTTIYDAAVAHILAIIKNAG